MAAAGGQDNPFMALFKPTQPVDSHGDHLSNALESVFRFTLDKSKSSRLLYLESMASSNNTRLTIAALNQALTDRIMMSDDELSAAGGGDSLPEEERSVCVYLLNCFIRLKRLKLPKNVNSEDRNRILTLDAPSAKDAIVKNLATSLFFTDACDGVQKLLERLQYSQDGLPEFSEKIDLLPEEGTDFLEAVALEMKNESVETTEEIFNEALTLLKPSVAEKFSTLGNIQCGLLFLFTRSPYLATLFMKNTYPQDVLNGRAYSETILGHLLTNSCIPKSEVGDYHFFENPSSVPMGVMAKQEESVQFALSTLHNQICTVFKSILKAGDEPKHLLLMWIGDCLKANSGRGKLWSNEMGSLMANTFVSDGFMLNLGSVLLRLCNRFTSETRNKRLLKIDLTYAASSTSVSEDARLRGVHLRDIKEETCICNASDYQHERSASSESFNFITDIFFLTQKCLDLGFRVVQEKFVKLNQELNRHQQLYREASAQNPEAVEQIKARMNRAMTRYLTLKAALMEPESLKHLMDLSSATSALLVQTVLQPNSASLESAFRPLVFPIDIKWKPPVGLFYVPEFFVENLCEHLLLAKRFKPSHFEEAGVPKLSEILNFILVFMGESKLMKNPHLRARLAECLECLLPEHSAPGNSGFYSKFNREQIFQRHKHNMQIVPALLSVFVSIEETGQAVEFEQKFSYRKPMYDVIKYIWTMPEYRKKFLELAEDSELHIEDENAPIFLRFVNLLINDAIFLLDEALSYMRQIGDQQAARPGWSQLPPQDRAQNEAQYSHIGRLARYHNIMGMETIAMINRLSSEIKAVFTHTTMVDRIAAMLNHFLKLLVGPERKQLKVDKLEDYEFRPGKIVHTICSVYANFLPCDAFLCAVSQDGRSYSPDLFKQAECVLTKVGKVDILPDLLIVAEKVKAAAATQEEEDALFADAPDHFLDAIMSVLMKDPVKLPTSGQVVDRQTIARHLLSDQTDPFNRSPLTLEKVIPLPELKDEIEQWMESKRRQKMQ